MCLSCSSDSDQKLIVDHVRLIGLQKSIFQTDHIFLIVYDQSFNITMINFWFFFFFCLHDTAPHQANDQKSKFAWIILYILRYVYELFFGSAVYFLYYISLLECKFCRSQIKNRWSLSQKIDLSSPISWLIRFFKMINFLCKLFIKFWMIRITILESYQLVYLIHSYQCYHLWKKIFLNLHWTVYINLNRI